MTQHTPGPTCCNESINGGRHFYDCGCPVGPRWIPPVTCSCGEPHRPGRRYYVSVVERQGGPYVLAAGPFLTHQDALAHVDVVRDIVLARYNPQGRAHWYLYGTAALPWEHTAPGRLNGELP